MAESLKVWVQPGASRDRVVGRRGGALKVAVSAPPEKGKANKAVEELLAREFGVRKSAVRVVSGKASRDKAVEFDGVSASDLRNAVRRYE